MHTHSDVRLAYSILSYPLSLYLYLYVCLCLLSDPDKPGGDTAKFQQLQASYQEILKKKAEAAATEREINGGTHCTCAAMCPYMYCERMPFALCNISCVPPFSTCHFCVTLILSCSFYS